LPRGVITPFHSRLDGGMLRREAWVCRKESERAVHRICLDGWRSAFADKDRESKTWL